ncbi:MAG: M23 family metallopeptidase [Myxococcaceae bacterium]|nr:M23 family metallopeptidase [Myxococcaceae bacterium]
MISAFSTALAVTLFAGLSVQVQPGQARPGDLVLITVHGATQTPTGTLGKHTLQFFSHGPVHQALFGLPSDIDGGEQWELSVRAGPQPPIDGVLEVLPAGFPKRELTVAARFISPSAKDRQQMAADARAFKAAFGQKPAARLFSGNFEWPRWSDITAPFGDQRMFNGKRQSQHYGTDIDGQTGDEVRASNDGVVVMTRECFGSGGTIILHHGMGLYTAYFHLSRKDVKQGQKVSRGELIGLVGKSGRVTGPHLHFGAKLDGRWVNAESLLKLDFE